VEQAACLCALAAAGRCVAAGRMVSRQPRGGSSCGAGAAPSEIGVLRSIHLDIERGAAAVLAS
jgi:hypothetical protein